MDTKLFSEFKSASDQDWIDKVLIDLKGAGIDSLTSHLPYEDIELEALYSKSSGQNFTPLKNNSDWKIRETKYMATDPIAILNNNGTWETSKEEGFKHFFSSFNGLLAIDTSAYGEAGASAIQELTFAVAHINEYLNHIQANDLKLEKVEIQLSITSEYFINIAKFRALRILISNLLNAYEHTDCTFAIHACNNSFYFSKMDVNGNILRSTTQCISAVLGGCDSISIVPHNALIDADGEFGKRVARNLQHMLKHEAHLDKVADPASGSYFLENLTKKLSSISWDKFKEVEAKAGYIELFLKGEIQSQIQQVLQKRIDRAKNGDDVLIGINKYQLPESLSAQENQINSESSFKLTPVNLESLI